MASVSSELIDAQEAHEAFLELAAGYEELAVTYRKQARQALAMAVAGYCLDPNAKSLCRNQDPVLLHVLQNLRVEAGDKPLVGRLDVPADADWPSVGLSNLSHRERLAMWLIRAGADPWAKDQDGKDALDLAVEAGSRSLVSMLLSHPQCPPLDALRLRTSNFPGRQVPWLHVAAYTDNAGLFEDLVDMGCDIHATDRQGWTALGWVNQPPMLAHLLERHSFFSQEIATASEAWQKRLLNKLAPHNFKVEPLRQTLEDCAPPSEEQALQTRLTDMANRWLSAKPTDKSYHFKGVKVTGIHEKDRELVDLIQTHWDWRIEIPSGAAKGTWSLLGAAVWGMWRGHVTGGEDHRKKIAGWVLQQLEKAGPSKAKAWLEEEFRPSLTNRGMLAWLVMADAAPEQKKALLSGSASLVWKEMVAFAKAAGGGSAWLQHMGHHFKSVALQYAQLFPSECDARFWNGVTDFAQSIGFTPSLMSGSNASEYALVATRAQSEMIQGSGVSEKTRQAWFRALVVLLSSGSYRSSSTDVVSARVRMWEGVIQAQQKDPVLFAFPADLPPPFTEKEAAQKTQAGHPVPSPSEWKAQQFSRKLDQDLTGSQPSAPRRPRM